MFWVYWGLLFEFFNIPRTNGMPGTKGNWDIYLRRKSAFLRRITINLTWTPTNFLSNKAKYMGCRAIFSSSVSSPDVNMLHARNRLHK